MVRLRIRHVRVEESLHPQGAEHTIIVILEITPELVFVCREKLGMADYREVQDLSTDTADGIVSGLEGERRSLRGDICVRPCNVYVTAKPLRVHTRLAPALLPLKMIFSGLTPRSFAFSLHFMSMSRCAYAQ